MTHSRFFQVSLAFPVAVWLVALIAFSFTRHEGNNFFMQNISDAYRVFVPYLIFAAGVWRLAGKKPYKALILMAAAIPIVWGFFFSLLYMVYLYGKEGFVDWLVVSVMAFWAAFVAYLFELVPLLALIIFKNNLRAEAAGTAAQASIGEPPSMPAN